MFALRTNLCLIDNLTFSVHTHCLSCYKDCLCPRDKLVFMKKLGEGQFGEVMLMMAEVSTQLYIQHTHDVIIIVSLFT